MDSKSSSGYLAPRLMDQHRAQTVETHVAEELKIVQQMSEIQNILGREYLNVAGRLKLDTVPYCVQNQMFCKKNHGRKCPGPKYNQRTDIVQTYSKHNRRLHSLKLVLDMCARMEFPGEDVLSNVLYSILIVKQSFKHSSNYLIEYYVVVAETIILKFPPCWQAINKAYEKVLMTKVDLKKYFPNDPGTIKHDNFFVVVLNMLVETISSSDMSVTEKNNSPSDDSNSGDEMFGFIGWLQRNSTKEGFTQHTREEKLDRLFLVLHILTKILEQDFSIWLLRHPSNPEQAMFSEATEPLVARVFFNGIYRQITGAVKTLLEIFVLCVCLSFPKEKVDILSRAVALLSVAINSCEKQPADEIRYPFVQNKAKEFAEEIYKTIENNFGRTSLYFLAVIKAIKVPFTKYLFINHLLYKMNRDQGNIFDNFQKKRWEQYEDGTRWVDQEISLTFHKYPLRTSNFLKRSEWSPIYQNEYINVLFDALRAYCETYQVENVNRVLCNSPVGTATSMLRPAKTYMKGLNLPKMEKDIDELKRNLNRKQLIVRCKADEMSYDNICVDAEILIQYCNDINSMRLLLIELSQQKQNRIFDEGCRFLDSVCCCL